MGPNPAPGRATASGRSAATLMGMGLWHPHLVEAQLEVRPPTLQDPTQAARMGTTERWEGSRPHLWSLLPSRKKMPCLRTHPSVVLSRTHLRESESFWLLNGKLDLFPSSLVIYTWYPYFIRLLQDPLMISTSAYTDLCLKWCLLG